MAGIATPDISASLYGSQLAQIAAQKSSLNPTEKDVEAATPHVTDAQKAKFKEKSKDFESFFIYQTIELMKPDGVKSEFSGGEGEEMFRHNLNEQIARNITNAGGIGIGSMVYKQLLQHQEQQNASHAAAAATYANAAQ